MARNAGEITIDGRDLMASIRIGVRLPRAFGIRMTIATWLFSLAGWVSGTNVAVEVDDEDGETVEGIRFTGSLNRLDIKPGDRFVLTLDRAVSADQVKGIREAWSAFMGEEAEHKLLILDSGMKLGAISGEAGTT